MDYPYQLYVFSALLLSFITFLALDLLFFVTFSELGDYLALPQVSELRRQVKLIFAILTSIYSVLFIAQSFEVILFFLLSTFIPFFAEDWLVEILLLTSLRKP